MGPQLTVLIIEVSLFQSVHNSRFDCMCIIELHSQCIADDSMYSWHVQCNGVYITDIICYILML